MSGDMLPIIRQMLDAESDAERALTLLNVPDLVLVKYAYAFTRACRRARFDAGEEWIAARLNAMRAVRDDMGNLPGPMTRDMMAVRSAMVAAHGRFGKENG